MKLETVEIGREDIHGLDELKKLVLECSSLDRDRTSSQIEAIGNILRNNALRLGLEEDPDQLAYFARSIACEMLSPEVRSKGFVGGCWSAASFSNHPPFYRKSDKLRLSDRGPL